MNKKIIQLVKSISNINSSVKNLFNKKINTNSTKKYNIDSPSFGCKKTKSVDDIKRKKLIINDNILLIVIIIQLNAIKGLGSIYIINL